MRTTWHIYKTEHGPFAVPYRMILPYLGSVRVREHRVYIGDPDEQFRFYAEKAMRAFRRREMKNAM